MKKIRNKLTIQTVQPAHQSCMPTSQMVEGLLMAMAHHPTTVGTTLETTEATTTDKNVSENSNFNPANSSGSMENHLLSNI